MKQSEEIQELKTVVNNLLVEHAKLLIEYGNLKCCFFQLLTDKFPDIEKGYYTTFVQSVKENTQSSLTEIEDVLFDTGDHLFLLRQKMNCVAISQEQMRDERYLGNDD